MQMQARPLPTATSTAGAALLRARERPRPPPHGDSAITSAASATIRARERSRSRPQATPLPPVSSQLPSTVTSAMAGSVLTRGFRDDYCRRFLDRFRDLFRCGRGHFFHRGNDLKLQGSAFRDRGLCHQLLRSQPITSRPHGDASAITGSAHRAPLHVLCHHGDGFRVALCRCDHGLRHRLRFDVLRHHGDSFQDHFRHHGRSRPRPRSRAPSPASGSAHIRRHDGSLRDHFRSSATASAAPRSPCSGYTADSATTATGFRDHFRTGGLCRTITCSITSSGFRRPPLPRRQASGTTSAIAGSAAGRSRARSPAPLQPPPPPRRQAPRTTSAARVRHAITGSITGSGFSHLRHHGDSFRDHFRDHGLRRDDHGLAITGSQASASIRHHGDGFGHHFRSRGLCR